MKRSTKSLLLTTALITTAITAAATTYRISANQLMHLALEREEPKFRGKRPAKLSGSEALTKVMEDRRRFATELEQIGMETVEIKSRDGLRLVGHYYSGPSPKRIIVAMHGWRSSWSQDFGLISNFWHQNDCAVLYAEQRGQGMSGGDYMGFGLLERHDCLDWVNWIHQKSGGALPIYLAGVSMGATTVLMTAGSSLPPSVRGIIADCGFTSPHAIWKHVVEHNLHLPFGLYSNAVKDFYQKKMQIASDSYSCEEALENCKVPILFIHGSDDKFVPVEMTYQNYKICKAPKRLLIVPGAEHGMSYLVDQPGYESAVKSFWSETAPI